MVKMKALTGVVALSALAAACSGGGSESSEPAETAAEAEAPAVEEPAAEEAAATEEPAAEETADAGDDAAAAGDGMATKDGVAFASLTGDAAAGKRVFAQCRTCHVTDEGVNRTGPSLHNIVGREAGKVAGFNYSPANANSGLTWTEEQLYVYLEDPQRVVPKTKMIFAGLPDAQKRADVIAYLKDPS